MSKDFLDFESDNVFLKDRTREVTFKQMGAFARSLAQDFEISDGSTVLMDVRDPIYFFGMLLACLSKNLRPALLNWYFSDSQIADLLQHNTYSAFITDQEKRINLKTIKIDSSKKITTPKGKPLHIQPESEVIFFSSGSVRIKPCLLTLKQFAMNAIGSHENIAFNAEDVWALCLPHFHVGGFSIFIRALVAKGSVFCISGLSDLENKSITHASLVSTQFIRALESDINLKSMKHILLGGSAIPETYLKKGISKGYSIHKSFGMTEMATQISTTAILTEDSNLGSSGPVLPFRDLKISDGKIYVKGPCLFKGYLENNKINLPLEDGWFDTRDLGYLREGELFVSGRSDRVFQCGGENISPETIERELLKIDGVLKAYVIPKEDLQYGLRPVAYMETTPKITSLEVQALLEKQLYGFHRPVAYLPWADSPKRTWK